MPSAIRPVALGLWAYISGKSLMPMLQLLHVYCVATYYCATFSYIYVHIAIGKKDPSTSDELAKCDHDGSGAQTVPNQSVDTKESYPVSPNGHGENILADPLFQFDNTTLGKVTKLILDLYS